MALNKLYLTLCKLETIYPEAAFIVAGDFNKANLKTRLPKFDQHIDCATRGGKTLDHCYSNFRDAYKALPGSIRVKLKAQTTAFNQGKVTGNMTEYKQCSYSLRKLSNKLSASTETK